VENCQDGVDDCRQTYVSREKLLELKKVCESTLLHPALASADLPTSAGFFFGTYDYDEWYFEGLKETIEIVDRCLEMPDEWDFYYQSSW
jgi:hypothetical protein